MAQSLTDGCGSRCSFHTGRWLFGIVAILLSVFILTHTTKAEAERVQGAFDSILHMMIPSNHLAISTPTGQVLASIKANLIEVEAALFIFSGIFIMTNLKTLGVVLFIVADALIFAAREGLHWRAIADATSEQRNDKLNYMLQHVTLICVALVYLADRGD